MSTVSKLEIVLEATTTAFDRGIKAAQDKLDGFAKKTHEIHRKMDKFSKKHAAGLKAVENMGKGAAVALAGITYAAKGAIDAAISLESSMAQVKKVVDFDTPQAFTEFRNELLKMSLRIPVAVEGLADIAAAAGQAGIPMQDLVKHTETAAKMATAFDITADVAGQAMAEMRASFKISHEQVTELADQINYLGNTTPNAATKIMSVVQQVGAIGEIAGISAAELSAMAASVVGLDASVTGTGIKNIALRLSAGVSATKQQKEAFRQLGMTAEEVAKGMQDNAMGTIDKIIEGVKKLPVEQQAAVTKALVGAEALPVFSQFITNQEMLHKNLKAVGDSSTYAGSMLKEYEAIAGTTANQMQLFDNNVKGLKIAIGDILLPVVNNLFEAITPVVKSITDWVNENPKMAETIGIVTVAVLGAVAALGGLALAFTAVTAVIGVISPPIIAVVAGITTLVAAGTLLWRNWDAIKAKAIEVFNGLPEPVKAAVEIIKIWLTMLVTIWQVQFEAIKAVTTLAMGSIKAVLTAAVTVFASVFNAGFAWIKNIFTTTFAVIKALVRGDMDGVKQAMSTGMKTAYGIIKQLIGDIIGAFRRLGSDLLQAGRDAIQGLIDGIKSKFKSVQDAVSKITDYIPATVKRLLDIHSPSRVMKRLGEHTADGLAVGITANTPKAVKAAAKMAQDVKKAVADGVANLKREIALFGDDSPISALKYDISVGKYGNENTSELMALTAQHDMLKRNQAVIDDINRIWQQIKTTGMDNLQVLEWEIANTDKYRGVSDEVLNNYRQKVQEQLTLNELLAERDKREQNRKSTADAFSNMMAGFKDDSPIAKIQAELDERLAIIKAYEDAHTDVEHQAQAARLLATKQAENAKRTYIYDTYQNIFSGIMGATKSFLGEQSGIYRAMFALEKGFAIGKAILALKANIAEASKVGYPQNIPMIAAAASQGMAIVSDIRSIAMPIGQAHDGIMSVPKSGTWNLEKGERVLPRYTAKHLDDKLAKIGNGNNTQNVVVNVTVNSDSGNVQANHAMGKRFGEAIKAAVQSELQRERRQGGLLYGR